MKGVVRSGISLEPELLGKFDEMIRQEGYTNRSEAIRDLIRRRLVEKEWEADESPVVGTITIVYDHDAGDVNNKLLHIQHDHHDEVRATTHVHVDAHTCIEVLVVQGKAGSVRSLADRIRSIKGVLQGELVMTGGSISKGSGHGHAHPHSHPAPHPH